jgi:hypothetical protein
MSISRQLPTTGSTKQDAIVWTEDFFLAEGAAWRINKLDADLGAGPQPSCC